MNSTLVEIIIWGCPSSPICKQWTLIKDGLCKKQWLNYNTTKMTYQPCMSVPCFPFSFLCPCRGGVGAAKPQLFRLHVIMTCWGLSHNCLLFCFTAGGESVGQFGNLKKKGVLSDIKITEIFISTQHLKHWHTYSICICTNKNRSSVSPLSTLIYIFIITCLSLSFSVFNYCWLVARLL